MKQENIERLMSLIKHKENIVNAGVNSFTPDQVHGCKKDIEILSGIIADEATDQTDLDQSDQKTEILIQDQYQIPIILLCVNPPDK